MINKAGALIPTIATALVLMTILLQQAQAQAQTQAADRSCLNQLVPCLNYLNSTRDVPDTCCDPLKSVVKSDPQCLCSMASNRGSNEAEQAGINVTEAQQLPGRCGVRVNPISCLTGRSNNNNNNRNGNDNDSSSARTRTAVVSWSSLLAAAALCITITALQMSP